MGNGPETFHDEESRVDKLARQVLSSKSLSFLMFGPIGALALLLGHLLREVERVDEETPQELEKQLLRLSERGDAEQLLRKLERVRTDVIHAFNSLEGLPKQRESFAVRLKRLNKQGQLPEGVYRQVLVVSRYRNRAVYESYHLRPEERVEVDRAMDEISKWAQEVGFVY
jgi:hypothetical protein